MSILDRAIERIIQNRVTLHILYWMAVFSLYCIYGLGHSQPLLVSVVLKMTVFPIQIIATYVFIYWQLPLIFNRRYLLFALSFSVLSYLFYLIVHINYDMGIGTWLISWHKPHSFVEMLTDAEFYFNYLVNIYLVVFVTATIKFIKDHLESRQLIDELESETSRVEYNILQAKVQPGLMLRSLQLIKSKSLEGSTDTPGIVESLSNVLDDALYQSKLKVRSLKEEVERLTTYAQLYALSSSIISQVQIESRLVNGHLLIRTLLLNNIIEEIFNQIEENSHSGIMIEILIIDEEAKCILQTTFNQNIAISLDKVIDIIDIVYKDKYTIEEIIEGMSKDIQIILEL